MQLQSALSIKLPATSHQMGATLAKEQFGDATKLERFGNIFVLRHSVSQNAMFFNVGHQATLSHSFSYFRTEWNNKLWV